MYIDISLPVKNDLPVWPGDPKISIRSTSTMDNGDPCNVSHMDMGVHVGTHIDAPHHFLNNNITIEQLKLETLIGDVFVTEMLEKNGNITGLDLENANIPPNIERLLIKTSNSSRWRMGETEFYEDFIAVGESGAKWIIEKKIKLVGVDYLSVAPYKDGIPTHKILLTDYVIVVEGLDLSDANEGYYDLLCLPLKIPGSDGAPARVVLKEK